VIERQLVFVGTERRLRYQNRATVYSRGLELESTYRDVEGRSAYASVAFAGTASNCLDEPTIFSNPLLDLETSNCARQRNAPVTIAKLGASSQLLLDTFHVSGELSYVSERVTQHDTDEDENVDPFYGLNVAVYVPDVNGFDVTVGGRNLIMEETVPAQEDYNRTNPNIDVLSVPGPGREVFGRVGYRF